MIYSVKELFVIFIIYSVLGWLGEIIGKLITDGKFINRGFLIGPYCPIYGVGAVLMVVLLQKYADDPFTLFIMSILVFSLLEYITSFIMEKIFNARWWDYTKYKFNINGRICLETMIPFGVTGLVAMYAINPAIYNFINRIPGNVLNYILIIILVLFILDICISISVMLNIKDTINKFKRDNTEEITKKVKEFIEKQKKLKRRVIKAFPKLKIK